MQVQILQTLFPSYFQKEIFNIVSYFKSDLTLIYQKEEVDKYIEIQKEENDKSILLTLVNPILIKELTKLFKL